MPNDFLLQFQHKFFLDMTNASDITKAVWTRMAAGWKSVDITGEENTDDTAYLDGNGGTTTTVMGGMISFEFTGDFDNGNEIHRFILGKLAQYGTNRIVNFKWETPAPEGFSTGYVFEGSATLLDLNPASGDANAKSEIAVTIRFNGVPKVTEPTPISSGSSTTSGS